jgi:hypothetical protein
MTDVYSTVLSDEITPQLPAESAQQWFDNLLMQLELDGFNGHDKNGEGLDGISHNSSLLLSNACRYFFHTY